MKRYLVLLLLIGHACIAQRWEAEVMAGLSGYNGDLTEKLFAPKSMGPAGGLNLNYNYNDILFSADVLPRAKYLPMTKIELAYRQRDAPYPTEGDIRGNPKVKDWYFITSLKLLIRLGRER